MPRGDQHTWPGGSGGVNTPGGATSRLHAGARWSGAPAVPESSGGGIGVPAGRPSSSNPSSLVKLKPESRPRPAPLPEKSAVSCGAFLGSLDLIPQCSLHSSAEWLTYAWKFDQNALSRQDARLHP